MFPAWTLLPLQQGATRASSMSKRRATHSPPRLPGVTHSISRHRTPAACTTLTKVNGDFTWHAWPEPFNLPQPHSHNLLILSFTGLAAVSRREGVPQFRLPQQPEFLFIEDATVHTRSWSENLSYYTGAGYLAGAMAGGGRGAFQALSTPLAVDGAGATQRLRLNQLLNTSGKLGRANGALPCLFLLRSGGSWKGWAL